MLLWCRVHNPCYFQVVHTFDLCATWLKAGHFPSWMFIPSPMLHGAEYVPTFTPPLKKWKHMWFLKNVLVTVCCRLQFSDWFQQRRLDVHGWSPFKTCQNPGEEILKLRLSPWDSSSFAIWLCLFLLFHGDFVDHHLHHWYFRFLF